MLSFEDAQRRLLSLAPRLAAERVTVDDACGRVLAEEVCAPVAIPAFDHSSMDGYAVASGELEGPGPYSLEVRGESKTGASPPRLVPKTACRIFTGAELPPGADAVVMQEKVTRDGATATFAERPAPGKFVRKRGDDLAAGGIALTAGTRLSPAHLALAAMVDRAFLLVSRRPVVTILGTGDELRSPGSAARPGSIPESNGVALRAMARAAGAIAHVGPYVRDDRAATEAALEAALRTTDVLVTVGGVSVGDHDLVRPALEAIGVTIDFWKVAIKPGKPLAVGRRGDAIVLGLPGNPASAMVTFALFGVPLLRALAGDARPFPPPLTAKVSHAVAHEPGRRAFVRATLSRADGAWMVTPLANQASGAAISMAQADALMCVPQDSPGLVAGTDVDVYPLAALGI